MKKNKMLLFSTSSYKYMLNNIFKSGGFDKGDITSKSFPDGERYLRINSSVYERDVALIGGTISDSGTLELYDLACSIVKSGARRLIMVIPYYGYSTMERAVKEGEVVTAKTRARLISSIPQASFGNKVMLLDLHSEGMPHYFEGDITTSHIYAKEVIIDAIKSLGKKKIVLASTDAGRAKWVESLGNDLRAPVALIIKQRLGPKTTKVKALSGDVHGLDVIIYDDMIRSGTSLINAAKAYKNEGASDVFAVATHGIFPGDALKNIEKSGLIKKIICTDSHPAVNSLKGKFLAVRSVAKILAKKLKEK